MSTADAVDRETAWLQTSGDSLPALVKTAGGPFDNVQAYFPRTPSMEERSLYVLRRRINHPRTANVRLMPQFPFHLIVWWPILDGTGEAEADQRALDFAVDLVLARIAGPLLDKTHGGRFLSVAENPRVVDVEFADPELTIPSGFLRADVTYSADDLETND